MASAADDSAAKKAETLNMLKGLWERSRPTVERRLMVLEEAAEAVAAGHLPNPLRAQAESEAHKLAGSLGMFGFTHGTELAREIEESLAGGAKGDLGALVKALSQELLA